MLGAVSYLHEDWIVDARVGRTAAEGITVLRSRIRNSGEQWHCYLVGLGTNNGISRSQVGEIVGVTAPKPVVLVTVRAPRPWRSRSNRVIRQAARTAGDRIRLMDWAFAARSQPSWFYDDGIHLRPEGQRQYALLAYQTVEKAVGGA